tara:strand:- start:37 stop:198 length:162 start_codon:yes stop_codon:yes gene_type:complete
MADHRVGKNNAASSQAFKQQLLSKTLKACQKWAQAESELSEVSFQEKNFLYGR